MIEMCRVELLLLYWVTKVDRESGSEGGGKLRNLHVYGRKSELARGNCVLKWTSDLRL